MRQISLFFTDEKKKRLKDCFKSMNELYNQINAYPECVSKDAARFNWIQLAFAIEKCEQVKIKTNKERLKKWFE